MARLKVSTKCHIALALVLFLFLVLTTLSVDSAKVSKTSFTSKTTAKTVPTTTTTTESSSSEDYYNPEDSREGNVSREDYAISDEPATSYQPGNGRSLPQTSYLNDEPSELSGINADLPEISEDDFCADNYVDAAYYNGYDLILTRGDRLYYYFKDEHRLSPPYKQSKFTQGDHIQGAFNISRIPDCRRSSSSLSSSTSVSSSTSSSLSSKIHDGDCSEISKMKGMAVYFLHNKDRARSYYNLDFRNRNGTQKRVRSRDLPWAMKQVGLLGGNMWPNGWESYQQHRPVAFLPSRYELIFIQNHFHESENGSFDHDSYRSSTSALLTWNTLDTDQWNTSWKSRIIVSPYPITYTGMFEMNGIVYAIGEHRLIDRNGNIRRIGKMFRYYVTEDDGRNLREMDQSVADFFGCPRIISDDYEDGEEGGEDEENSTEGPIPTVVQPPNLVSSSTVSPTSTTTATSTTTTTTPEPTTRKLITTTTSTTSTTTTTTATTPKPTSTTTTTTTTTPKSSTTTTKPKQSSKKPKSRQSLEGESSENSLESNDTITARRKPSSDVFLTSANSVFLRNSKAKIFPLAPSNNVSNVLNVASTPLNFRESDSILLTIFIGIVISACVATIILAFLTISGKTRSRRKMPPRFEGARIERTIPKPTIIGIDYHPRKNSSASGLNHMNLMTRYDSMNSINAIYSQIKKPILSSNPVAHASLQHQRSLSMRNPNPYGMAGMGCSENRLHGYASPPNSGGVSTFSRPSHNISSPSSRRQNGQPPHSHTQFGGSFHNFDLFN